MFAEWNAVPEKRGERGPGVRWRRSPDMRAGLGEGGELAEARVRSARGEGPTAPILRDSAKMRAYGAQEFRTFFGADHSVVPGSVDHAEERPEVLSINRIDLPVRCIPPSGTRRYAALAEHCPGRLVGPGCHYAVVHCRRAHGHFDCRAPERTRVAAETESSGAPRAISRPGAMDMRSGVSRIRCRSAMGPGVVGEDAGEPDKSDENVGGRDDTAQCRPGGRSA